MDKKRGYSNHLWLKYPIKIKKISLTQKTNRFTLMGRMMGFEPTHDGATIRCVNHFTTFAIIKLAGAVGIEPTLTVLETGVLPLYEAPIEFALLLYQIFYKKASI